MTPRRLLLVPLCFLASVHASAQQRDTTAQLAGVVFSAYTGRPLVGATVRSETRETITEDRKSTRLNSSHGYISYAVFCLKKKKRKHNEHPLDSCLCIYSTDTIS